MKTLIKFLRQRISIQGRLLLMFLVPGVIYYLFSTALSFSHMQGLSRARIDELRIVVESAIGKTSAQFLNRGLKEDLNEVLKTLVDETSVAGIAVYDVDSTLFASAGGFEPTIRTTVFEKDIFHAAVVPDFDELDFNEGVYKGRPEFIGKLKVIIDTGSTVGISWQAAIRDSFLLLITILLCSPLYYALYQSFSGPLGKILENILDFERDNLGWIEEEDIGSDEFTRVKQALKRVATTVIDQRRQISIANSTLEHRAKELEKQVYIATEAREEADKANAQKDIFVANVSHEMRQPLVGVVSGVDLVEQFILAAQTRLMKLNKGATPEQYQALTNIRADLKESIKSLDFSKKYSKELIVMVDDLLASIQDMYQEFPLKISGFVLYDCMDVLFKSHYRNVTAKGLHYSYEINGINSDSTLYVKGDWVRISQVVNALTDNAVRFTESGKISVLCDITTTDSTANISIIVRDTGVGISEHERDSIFKLFHIGEDPANKKYAGLGTGLTIAQKISIRLMGSLKLEETSVGEGSKFSFNISLPLSSVTEIVSKEEVAQVEKALTLLYVEDSAINRLVFQQYCQLSGIELILAKNGKEGIEKYNSHHFDALIVDCFMPTMNGFEFTKTIRKREADGDSGHIPIFALTAEPSTRNRERCFEAGFDEFLTKPYTNATFKFIIDRIGRIQAKAYRS